MRSGRRCSRSSASEHGPDRHRRRGDSRRAAGRPADRHGLRPLRRPVPGGSGTGDLPAEAAAGRAAVCPARDGRRVPAASSCRSCAAALRRWRARCCRARYTLILPNPARRYRWLTGSSPETIGVRVPELSGPRRRGGRAGRRGGRDEREPPRRARGPSGSRTCPRRSGPARPPSSTAASSRARPRRCSTSRAPSRGCCARAPSRPPRPSSARPPPSAGDGSTHPGRWRSRRRPLEHLRTRGARRGRSRRSRSCSAASSSASAARSS